MTAYLSISGPWRLPPPGLRPGHAGPGRGGAAVLPGAAALLPGHAAGRPRQEGQHRVPREGGRAQTGTVLAR